MNKNDHPLARKEGLIIQAIGNELVVYDSSAKQAHNLNATATKVWKLCNGKRSVSEIAQIAGRELHQPVSEQVLWYALARLEEYGLLESTVSVPTAMAGISRREFLTKFAVAAAIVPVVKTMKVPGPAQAGSFARCGDPCDSSTVCESPCTCLSAGGAPFFCGEPPP